MEEKKTPDNQQQNYLKKEEIDFRDTIVSILAKAGYYPEVNENRIDFDYQGDTFIVFLTLTQGHPKHFSKNFHRIT